MRSKEPAVSNTSNERIKKWLSRSRFCLGFLLVFALKGLISSRMMSFVEFPARGKTEKNSERKRRTPSFSLRVFFQGRVDVRGEQRK